jgi:EmrB/QacA subfamily drug resistance transporter
MNADHPNRKWWTLGAMCFGLFMIMLDNTVVNIALPSIQHSLNASQSELEWCLNSYVLTFAVLILLGGKLGDRFGRKRLFMIGLLIFTAASASCALAPGIGWLIGSRVAQGVGAAILNPLSLSILVNAFPRKQLPTAIGVWAGISGLGLAAGPLIGGWLVESVSWSAVFWINVPIGAIALVATIFAVDESRDLRSTRLDLVGTALITAGLFALVWALIETNSHSWTSAYILSFLGASVVLVTAFVVWELRVDQPMLPLSFFKSRAFTVSNIVVALVGVALFGSLFWITFYLQNVNGYSALEAGVRSMPLTLMILIVAPQAGRFARVFGPRVMMTFGMTLATIGMLGLAQLGVHSSYNHLWPFFCLIGIGMASTMPAVTGTAMAAVDPSRSGIASGVVNAMRQIGGALGIALLGAVASQATSSFWSDHVPRLAPSGALRDRLDAAGGSILSGRSEALQAIARDLPGQTAARIHETALQAFVHGMDQALYVGGALTACAAIISAVAQVRMSPAHSTQPAHGAVEI